MKNLWKGLAIVGIWTGVGLVAFSPAYPVTFIAAIAACFATAAVAGAN